MVNELMNNFGLHDLTGFFQVSESRQLFTVVKYVQYRTQTIPVSSSFKVFSMVFCDHPIIR